MTTPESVESRPVSVGAPSTRNLARATIEAVAFTACFGLASALVRPDWAPVYPAVMVAALLIAWAVAYLVTCEVVVARGIVETRGWLRMGRHVRGQTILVSPDQPLVRMPDGRWWLGGRTVGLNVPRWETTRLVDAFTGAGIAIIDTQTAWRRSHRGRIWAYRVSWAAWLCGLWGNLAFSVGHNFLPQFFSVAVMLAGVAAVFWLRPPQTIGPQPIWPSGSTATPAGSRRSPRR